ncbi:leucine-rich repeat-containing protein 66 [Mantella aurantiaca]
MEGPCLFLLIACLLAASASDCKADSLYSGCQRDNVHFLNCRSTGITTLGEFFFLNQEIGNVTSSNQLQRYLRSTKNIDLSYNMMSALYLNVFYKFSSLEILNISNNQIYRASMNKNGKQYGKGAFLTSLHTLVLNGNRLIAIPKGLCKLKSLQTLGLSANRILYIQRDDFANCTKLQHIDLGENRIGIIHPDAFQDLINLQVLKLHRNTLVSLSPLVFLFKHILKADIDLSENLWACDCSLQPLKYLISSLSTNEKPWNVTCHTPFSKTGQHILSIENSKSCQTSDYSYVYAKTLLITAGEEASLDCESFNQLGNKDVLWWTPNGIILKERQNINRYLSNTNSLILDQPEYSDEGLYICLTNAERIVYKVGIQENNLKSIRRSPRDLQFRNARMQTQYNFDLAVSLSVILTFLVAFFLGLFIRPYLESLWRKRCKSKNAEAQPSDAVYENEGFTADQTTRKHSGNSNMSSIPLHNTRHTSEKPDNYKVEAENIIIQERAIDVQYPTYNAVQEMREDINELDGKLPKTKRVTWASDEDFSTKVNLKYVMSLIKPINFIVLDSSMPDMVHNQQSNTQDSRNFDTISGHKNYQDTTKMSDDSYSSDEGSSFSLGSEYDISDDDSIISTVLQDTEQRRQDCNDKCPTINLQHVTSLLKPIYIIVPDSTYPNNGMEDVDNLPENPLHGSKVPESSSGRDNKHKNNKDTSKTLYDTSSSDESSINSFDSEYELSDKDEILNFNILGTKESRKASNENDSPTVNLKYVMALLKPINIIVPELTRTKIVKSPKQNQFFPLNMSTDPENRIEKFEYFPHNHDQDKRITNDQNESQLYNTSGIHYTVAQNDSSSSDEESNISVDSEHYFSAEDAFIDFHILQNQTRLANETLRPTVNLKHVISSLKPIRITIPDSTMPIPIIPIEQNEHQLQSIDSENQYSDSEKAIDVTQPVYDRSSSEDSSNDDSASLEKPLPGQWISNDSEPTVNLRLIISTLKPIEIKVPDESHYSDPLISPKEDFKVTSEKFYYYSSPDEHSNDSSDSNHDSSDEFVTSSTLPVPTLRKRAGSEKVYHTVNLKHVLSSLNPIRINIPDPTDYSDTLVTPRKDSNHDSSDEFVARNSILPVPTPRKRAGSQKVYPIVNLKHIISSLKPIRISIPDSTDYSDTLVTATKNTEVTQNLYDFMSSVSSIDSADSEHEGSDEDIIMNPKVSKTIPTELKNDEDVTHMVNLKYIISSLKPMNIKISDSTHFSNPHVSPDENKEVKLYDRTSSEEEFNDLDDTEYEDSYKNVIRGPILPEPVSEEWASSDNIYYTVNLKQIICSLKPIQIKAPDDDYSDTSMGPKNSTEVTSEHLYDNCSSNESISDPADLAYDGLATDVSSQPNQTETMPAEWEICKDVYSTMNLKYLISLLKPIHVNVPDSTHFLDTHVRPKEYIEVTQKQFDNTSESSTDSFDSKYESSDEEVIRDLALLAPTAIEWESNEDRPPTVNLKQAIYSFKPIRINIPDTTRNLDTDVTQKLYDFSASDTTTSESSNESADSEHEGTDEEVLQSINLPELTTKWKHHDYLTPTVNLKHVISLLKPIHIKVPDMPHYSIALFQPNTEENHTIYDGTSSDESSNDSFDLKHQYSNEEVKRRSSLRELASAEWATNETLTPIVNLKHIISSLKPIQFNVPESTHHSDAYMSPEKNTEVTTQRLHDCSSFDESSYDFVDSEHSDEDFKRSNLPKQIPTILECNKVPSPTVNLKHIMSFFKPLYSFTVSDSIEYSGFPKYPNKDANVTQEVYDILPNESSYKSVSSDEDVMSGSGAEITPKLYDSDSSDEDSNESFDLEHEGSDEEMIRSSILPKLTLKESANNENVYTTIDLKHAISLLKPISFAVLDSNHYSDTLVHSKKNIERVTQNLNDNISIDEQSNDSSGSIHEDLDEEVIISSTLPEPPIIDWASNKNLSPTVNLTHIISSFRPICIVVAHDFKMTTVLSQQLYNNSSPDNSSYASTDSEHESSCEYLMSLPLPKPVQTEEIDENVCPTVNLKYAISLLNPIQINVPDITCYPDILISPNENIKVTSQKLLDYSSSDESSSNHVDSEHESSDEDVKRNTNTPKLIPTTWADTKNLCSTVNLGLVISNFKPLHITVADSDKPSDTLMSPNTDTEVMKKLYGNISPDTILNGSDNADSDCSEEVTVSNSPAPVSTQLIINQNDYPTVNLKNVISSFKPIHIELPHSTIYSESFEIPMEAVEVSKKLYKNNSSEESSAESGHEGSYEVTNQKIHNNSSSDEDSNDLKLEDSLEGILLVQHSTLHKPTTTEWARNENLSPTVNIQHIISFFKPIKIKVQDSPYHSDSLKTLQENIEFTQEEYDDSSADSDNEEPDKSVIKSTFLPKQTPTETAENENAYPTVNLKHVISLLKPIKIKASELNEYEDTSMTPKKNTQVISRTVNDISLSDEHSEYFADTEHVSSDDYAVRRTEWARNEHVYPTVNLKNVTFLVKPIRIRVPDSAPYSDTLRSSKKVMKVTAEKHFDNSSSDESSKDSADSEHENSNENLINSNLAKTTLLEWRSTEMAYPTVNLKNVKSLLKPIRIMAPDATVPEVVNEPKFNQFYSNNTPTYKENQTDDFDKYQAISQSFSQPKSRLPKKKYKPLQSYVFKYPSKHTNVMLTSYKKMSPNNTSDNIDEWGYKGLNKGDAINSDLFKSKMTAQASNNNDAAVVNLKYVMSLIKPLHIIDPELTMPELVKRPPPIPPRKSRKELQELSPSSFHEKAMASRSTEQHSSEDLITFDFDSSEEDAL